VCVCVCVEAATLSGCVYNYAVEASSKLQSCWQFEWNSKL